jgi:hypothetical protein
LPAYEAQHLVALDLTTLPNPGEAIESVSELAPHAGTDFSEIKVLFEDEVELKNFRLIGAKQNTLSVKTKKGIACLKFFFKSKDLIMTSNGWEYKEKPLPTTFRMRIVGKPNMNEWQGVFTPQLFIEDFEILPFSL